MWWLKNAEVQNPLKKPKVMKIIWLCVVLKKEPSLTLNNPGLHIYTIIKTLLVRRSPDQGACDLWWPRSAWVRLKCCRALWTTGDGASEGRVVWERRKAEVMQGNVGNLTGPLYGGVCLWVCLRSLLRSVTLVWKNRRMRRSPREHEWNKAVRCMLATASAWFQICFVKPLRCKMSHLVNHHNNGHRTGWRKGSM